MEKKLIIDSESIQLALSEVNTDDFKNKLAYDLLENPKSVEVLVGGMDFTSLNLSLWDDKDLKNIVVNTVSTPQKRRLA